MEPVPISTLPQHISMQARLKTIGTDIVEEEMATTDDWGCIPEKCQDVAGAFREKTRTLPPHMAIHNVVDLEPKYNLARESINHLPELYFWILKAFI